jgi:hypothetical protein
MIGLTVLEQIFPEKTNKKGKFFVSVPDTDRHRTKQGKRGQREREIVVPGANVLLSEVKR